MAVNVDIICSSCGEIHKDQWSDRINLQHSTSCPGVWERLWTVTHGNDPMCNPADRCVVYVSSKEGGKIQYPGRNDAQIPERLRQRGYERLEMSPRQVMQFERKNGVANERLNYNRNGKGMGD